MTKKYHVDLTSLVVDHRTYEKLNSEHSNRKEFLKRLVDDDAIEIVNIEEADEDISLTIRPWQHVMLSKGGGDD